MKDYKVFTLVIALLSSLYASAQNGSGRLNFSAYAGYATYEMNKLKEINNLTEKLLPFEVKNVNNFDPGFYFGGSLQTLILSNIYLGLIYQYYTTGSRIGQKDYSGFYAFDQRMNGHLVGVEPEIILTNKKEFSISSSVQVGALFSEIKMNEYLLVGEIKNQDYKTFSAFSIVIYPSVKISVPIYRRIRCLLSFGRMFDTSGKVHLSNDKNALLLIDDTKVKTGWSGWRITTGLTMNLSD